MRTLYISKAEAVGNLSVNLFFNDNTSRIVNIGDYIRRHPHPQYNKYLDEALFNTFQLEDGNIVWGEDWDLIFPIEQLHQGFLS